MKRIAIVLCLLTTQISFGQQMNMEPDTPMTKSDRFITPRAVHNSEKATPFWTEDFANGIPSGWTILDSSGICPWTYSFDGSWGNFNGNGGTAGGDAIASTTAANGFLICDPDSANNVTYGQPSGSNYQYLSSYINTPSIDCSGRSTVVLSFEQFFRYNNGVGMFVGVSTDNVNFTTYNVSGGQANNAASDNVDLVSLNITSTAANQPNVYIKIGWSARVYFWQIDDISLSEADPNDIVAQDSYWGTDGLRYYQIPTAQVAPIDFSAFAYNFGYATQTNVMLNVDVDGGATFSGTSAAVDIASGLTDSLGLTTQWTPASTVNSHEIVWDITQNESDATPSNNILDTINIAVTDYIYARDMNVVTGSTSNTGFGYEVGNLFDIWADQTCTAVDVNLRESTTGVSTQVGALVYAKIYSIDPASGDFVFEQQSDYHTVTTADLTNTLTLPLISPLLMTNTNLTYLAVVCTDGDGGVSDDVVVTSGGVSPAQTSFYYDATDATWYYTTRTPMVRLNFDPNISGASINEIALTDVHVYPNPANDELTIELTPSADETTLELVDMNGKIVMTQVHSMQAGQMNSVTLNTSSLEEGAYTLSIQVGEVEAKERVVLMH